MRVVFTALIATEKILEKLRLAALQNLIAYNFLHSIKVISWTHSFERVTVMHADENNLQPIPLRLLCSRWPIGAPVSSASPNIAKTKNKNKKKTKITSLWTHEI